MRGIAEQVAGPDASRLLGVTAELAEQKSWTRWTTSIGDIHVPNSTFCCPASTAQLSGLIMAGYFHRRHRYRPAPWRMRGTLTPAEGRRVVKRRCTPGSPSEVKAVAARR